MPISREEFTELRRRGVSVEQIARMEEQDGGADAVVESPAARAKERRFRDVSIPGVAPISPSVLPTLLATVGGFAPGPLGIAGAGAGGAAGEAALLGLERLLGQGPPEGGYGAAIAGRGAQEAAAQAVGGVIGKGAAAIGKQAMHLAVRPAKTLTQEFGDIPATMIRERIPVGGLKGRKGSDVAKRLRKESSETTKGLLRGASAAGTRVPAREAVAPVLEEVRRLTKLGHDTAKKEAQRLYRMAQKFMNENPNGVRPIRAKKLKQDFQRRATRVLKAEGELGYVPPTAEIKARGFRGMAGGLKGGLEKRVRGLEGSEARTQSLIGAQRAVESAEGRNLPLFLRSLPLLAATGSAVPQGFGANDIGRSALTYLLVNAALNPAVNSRVALGLTSPAFQLGARNLPRALMAASEADADTLMLDQLLEDR